MAVKRATYAAKEAEGEQVGSIWRHGRVRVLSDVIKLASQTSSDTIPMGMLPKGARVLYGFVSSTASLGSARLNIGTSGDANKYASNISVSSSASPVFFGTETSTAGLTEEEEVIIDINTASLPGSGSAVVTLLYVTD